MKICLKLYLTKNKVQRRRNKKVKLKNLFIYLEHDASNMLVKNWHRNMLRHVYHCEY